MKLEGELIGGRERQESGIVDGKVSRLPSRIARTFALAVGLASSSLMAQERPAEPAQTQTTEKQEQVTQNLEIKDYASALKLLTQGQMALVDVEKIRADLTIFMGEVSTSSSKEMEGLTSRARDISYPKNLPVNPVERKNVLTSFIQEIKELIDTIEKEVSLQNAKSKDESSKFNISVRSFDKLRETIFQINATLVKFEASSEFSALSEKEKTELKESRSAFRQKIIDLQNNMSALFDKLSKIALDHILILEEGEPEIDKLRDLRIKAMTEISEIVNN